MKTSHILYAVCGGLLLLSGGLTYAYIKESNHNQQLESTLKRYEENDKKSEVTKRVSKQMEDIAYQQKAISDKERENAELQTEIAQQKRIEAQQQTVLANQMRDRAEAEQRNAQKAAQQARASEERAQEQRVIAEDQRKQAEFAKRTTDTLSYVSLARSMASQAMTSYNAGKKDIAGLLAYGSYYYTQRYGGDPYYPAIFNALSLVSGNRREFDFHDGGIKKVLAYGNSLLTVGEYGEVVMWNGSGNNVKQKELLHLKQYNFRDAVIEGNNLYAIDRDGSVLRVNLKNPSSRLAMKFADGKFEQLVLVGDNIITASGNNVYVINKGNLTLQRTLKAPETVVCIGKYQGKPTLFTNRGKVYFLNKDDSFKHELTMGIGDISAFTSTKSGDMVAFGTKSGMVYVMDYPKMKNLRKIKGHNSTVTQVEFHDNYFLTSSFDHTLKLWDRQASKLDPITLGSVSSWLGSFYIGTNNLVWCGESSGALTCIDASPKSMADKIHKDIKRELTPAEWNYYVGKGVPYQTFKDKK